VAFKCSKKEKFYNTTS